VNAGGLHNAPSAWGQRRVAPGLGSRLRTEVAQRLRQRPIILGYHGVGHSSFAEDPNLLRVRPDRFRVQIETLIAVGYRFVTMAEFGRTMTGDGQRPFGCAAITFDDGLRDNHERALPILTEYGIPATVYVIAGIIGKPNPRMSANSGLRMMTESELRALVAAGWDLGAHSMTHPDMSTLPYDVCLREMVDSKRALEELAGVAAETFSYPFGSYGPAAVAAAHDAGFIAAVSTELGDNRRYLLQRAMIGGADAFPIAFLKVAAAYQPKLSGRPAAALRRPAAALRRLSRDVRRRGLLCGHRKPRPVSPD
jgi:peptidoglycan/xylan/chitin deacetylase (PgdA/CDA1 family)